MKYYWIKWAFAILHVPVKNLGLNINPCQFSPLHWNVIGIFSSVYFGNFSPPAPFPTVIKNNLYACFSANKRILSGRWVGCRGQARPSNENRLNQNSMCIWIFDRLNFLLVRLRISKKNNYVFSIPMPRKTHEHLEDKTKIMWR